METIRSWRRAGAALPAPAKGALWMMLSAACIVGSTTLARHLLKELPLPTLIFVRNCFGLLWLVPFVVATRGRGLKTDRPGAHFVRGIAAVAGIYLLFGAVALIPVADAMAINFTRPILASIAAVVVLGEVLSARRIVALGIGFAGALIILRPGFMEINLGAILAIGAAITGVVSAILIKSLTRTELPDTIAVYILAVSLLISAIPAAFVWQTPTLEQCLWLVALAFFMTAFQRTVNRAYAAADASYVLPFEFTRLIFAALAGLAMFGEFPDLFTWIGGAVIFAGVLSLARRETASQAAAR